MAATRAQWAEWRQLLDDGVYGSKAELAWAMGVSRAAVTKGLAKLHFFTAGS
jgi:hypothetical protein